MTTIDLNCDMGESYAAYRIGNDGAVFDHITSANVACGWHAGDPRVMDQTVAMAVEYGVGVGAHPGFPDRVGFGRRNMACTVEEIRTDLIYQIGALQAFCRVHGTRLRHVKPHGALYLSAVEDADVARAVAEAIASVDKNLRYVALAGSRGALVRRIGEEVGLNVVYEAFPDRAYTPEGTLASRREPGAVISDPEVIGQRALKMATENCVVATDGTILELDVQTLCVHGDTPTAADAVRVIRQTLESAGVELAPMA